MSEQIPLFDDYVAHILSADEFAPVIDAHWGAIFEDIVEFKYWQIASEDAIAARDALRCRMGDDMYVLNLVVRRGDEVVGWTTGRQLSSHTYTMSNSAVLPSHRHKGVYTAMVRALLDRVRAEGFQTVTSHHHATNNDVLIAKLKLGFVIGGFEISDMYGMLVNLTYHFDSLRREAMAFRAGAMRPGPELRGAMGLDDRAASHDAEKE